MVRLDGDHRPSWAVLPLGYTSSRSIVMLQKMSGFEMFCERCGDRHSSDDPTPPLPFARRFLMAVGVVGELPRAPAEEPLLRFCLACRGYSCPGCWNEVAGFCQTCVPMPESIVIAPQVEPEAAIAFLAPQPEPAPAFAEPESVVVAKVEPEPVVVAAAEPEPPLPDYTFDDAAAEPDFDVTWDWSIDEPIVVARAEPIAMDAPEPEPERVVMAEPEPEPVVMAEPEPEPVVTAEPEPEPVVMAEREPEPVLIAESEPERYTWPQPIASPVFRPLEPIGPIVPPPPPAARPPQISFDVPERPPAFLLAKQHQTIAQAAPLLPAGLFDGPAPSVRPCASCELPVSAKARFCRRCGSAQG